MHGQPRKPARIEDAAVSTAKAEALRNLQTQFIHNHRNQIYTDEAIEVSAKLLEVNPEIYTAWNYRKLAVQNRLGSVADPEAINSVLDEELRVAEVALKQNPKAYGAWHHRKWVLKKGHSSIDRELRLLGLLLKLDGRNFHGWNHMRFIYGLKNVSEEEELKFSTDKIYSNFSNYSAWHNRSVILSKLLKEKAVQKEVLSEEYEFIHNAIFTDPDDQSGWFYHRWLLNQTITPENVLLIGSWPINGSELVLSTDRNNIGCTPVFMTSHHLKYVLHTGSLPIILYFSQPLKGLNSSTVTVESILGTNGHLDWRPVSMNNSGESHSWMTYVEIPDLGSHDAKQTFTVSFGNSEGIISTNCSCCIYPFQFQFTVDWSYTGSEYTERNVGAEVVDWKDENFNSDTLPHDLSDVLISLDQLRISKDNEATFSKWHLDTLSNEIDLFRDLSSDGSCKIANLTLARLLVAKDMVSHGFPVTGKRIHSQEVLDLFDGLMKMDPPHSQYYKDEHSLVLMDQITSDKEKLRKRCSHYRTPSSSSHAQYVCLRLNRLSLSRIGFFERLLWVQMLDLSHNEVRSIEGLEAMQLLCCLNLSNNKIRSFSALGPLRLIKSLRVLDISNNEIGAHSTDSNRYTWPSPLSHNTEEYMKDVEQTAHWEAILIFKGLILTQLDVKGNAIADESLQALLPRVLPTLKWLDRVEL